MAVCILAICTSRTRDGRNLDKAPSSFHTGRIIWTLSGCERSSPSPKPSVLFLLDPNVKRSDPPLESYKGGGLVPLRVELSTSKGEFDSQSLTLRASRPRLAMIYCAHAIRPLYNARCNADLYQPHH